MKYVFFLVTTAFMISGCGLQEKEQALKKKEAELNQREQELILREKTLQFKEEELAKQQKKLDTLSTDSAFLQHPKIPGVWSVKMKCEEASCPGFAVGDEKTEQWIIAYEANHVIVRVMSGNKLARVYTGSFNGNNIELIHESRDEESDPAAQMLIRLTIKDQKSMEGQREILRTDCKVVYALDVQKKNQ